MTTFAPTVLTPEQRSALAADSTVGGGNLLRAALATNPHPEVPFLHSARPIATSAGELKNDFSLAEFDALAQSWSVWYLAQGVGVRDRVAVWLEDSLSYSLHFYALAQIGAVALLINSNASRTIVESLVEQTTPVGLYADREQARPPGPRRRGHQPALDHRRGGPGRRPPPSCPRPLTGSTTTTTRWRCCTPPAPPGGPSPPSTPTSRSSPGPSSGSSTTPSTPAR